MSLASGIYKAGLRVAKEVSNDIPTLMDKFGTYGRVTRPGNVPGWAAPSRLENRAAHRAYNRIDFPQSPKINKKQNAQDWDTIDNLRDQMERGEPQLHVPTSALRGHIRTHLKSKGIKHTPRTGESRGTSSFYAPKGGDLDAKAVTDKRMLSKAQLLKLRRNAGPKGGMR